MGSFLGGGGRSRSTSTSTPDPVQQEINRFYLENLRGIRDVTGGIQGFLNPNPYPWQGYRAPAMGLRDLGPGPGGGGQAGGGSLASQPSSFYSRMLDQYAGQDTQVPPWLQAAADNERAQNERGKDQGITGGGFQAPLPVPLPVGGGLGGGFDWSRLPPAELLPPNLVAQGSDLDPEFQKWHQAGPYAALSPYNQAVRELYTQTTGRDASNAGPRNTGQPSFGRREGEPPWITETQGPFSQRLFSLSPEEAKFQDLIARYTQGAPGAGLMERILGGTGGLERQFGAAGAFAGQLRDAASGSPETARDTQAIRSIQDLLTQSQGLPGFDPTAANEVRGLLNRPDDPTAIRSVQELLGGPDSTASNAIRELLRRSMGGVEGLEAESLQTMRDRTDPRMLTEAARRYMEEIAGPEARAASQAGGMGGVKGGAFGEGLAREGARLALPIAQLVQAATGELGAAQERIGGARGGRALQTARSLEDVVAGQRGEKSRYAALLEDLITGQTGRRVGLARNLEDIFTGQERMREARAATTAGLARNLFDTQEGLERRRALRGELALRGIDLTGRLGGDVARLGAGLDLHRLGLMQQGQQNAAFPRLLALQDFLRRQDLTTSSMLGIPVSTGGTTTSRGRSGQDFSLGSLLQLTGTGIGVAGALGAFT